MRKIQMSIAALSVIFGAIAALAFKRADRERNSFQSWFIYTGTQTITGFNNIFNYRITDVEPSCSKASILCAIYATIGLMGLYPLAADSGGPIGTPLGTNIAAYMSHVSSAWVLGANFVEIEMVDKGSD